jgi:polyisoprenoid-binding protein YceI
MPVLGPDNGTLTVKTGKGGAAAKAGHNLVIDVTSWRGSFDLDADPAIELTADARSLRVRSGSCGLSPLGDAEKASIAQTIDDEVLRGAAIEFRSTRVDERPGGRLDVEGELELLGTRRPLAFVLYTSDDGRITGSAVVRQTNWGIKPYSALFGTLKVADEVEVLIDAQLPSER